MSSTLADNQISYTEALKTYFSKDEFLLPEASIDETSLLEKFHPVHRH